MQPPSEDRQLAYLRSLGYFALRTVEYGDAPQAYIQAFDVTLKQPVRDYPADTTVACLCVSWYEDQIQVWEDGEVVAAIPIPTTNNFGGQNVSDGAENA